MGLAVDPPLHD